jgi:hypothetical protein
LHCFGGWKSTFPLGEKVEKVRVGPIQINFLEFVEALPETRRKNPVLVARTVGRREAPLEQGRFRVRNDALMAEEIIRDHVV